MKINSENDKHYQVKHTHKYGDRDPNRPGIFMFLAVFAFTVLRREKPSIFIVHSMIDNC